MNIRFKGLPKRYREKGSRAFPYALFFALIVIACSLTLQASYSSDVVEPVHACVFLRDEALTAPLRHTIARCLGWQDKMTYARCQGYYQPVQLYTLAADEIQIFANNVSFYNTGRSTLSGDVEVRQTGRILNAETAYVYRNAALNQVTRIELLGKVRYAEPERLLFAHRATFNPEDKSGITEDVVYRFNSQRAGAILPAWGRAKSMQRFANKDYLLQQATYSTCAPQDDAWYIEAKKITIDNASSTGVARNAKLFIKDYPFLYLPYLSFPTSKERKSGFLLPTIGSSNVGGLDMSLPYYWNMAPNYDATITPHVYGRRGLMMGSQFRYLTPYSAGDMSGQFLPNDKAYRSFLQNNEGQYPFLQNASTDRWAVQLNDVTQFSPNLSFKLNFQQVSDDYYLQDFTSNLAVLTERQLVREGELDYATDHWFFRSMLQSYQTLQPINQTPVSDIYQRLPQLLAIGNYDDLPFNANVNIMGQYDNFDWPNHSVAMPRGPRYYLNPMLSTPYNKPWGFVTPSVEMVTNYYDVKNYYGLLNSTYQRAIPRYSLDGGLFFERDQHLFNQAFIQTLEPRLYYLYVPYHDQTPIPVYDSSYLIFNVDQLFRSNRFSGFDRIGDANQLAYALSTRWLDDESGAERASFSVGQIRYFANRRVTLCQNPLGGCTDNPYVLGYLSPLTAASPIASRAMYHFNRNWFSTGDFVWNPNTHATNNGHIDIHYQPQFNQLVGLGYTYMVIGDITQVGNTLPDVDPLHQITLSYAWPFTDKWSSFGAYSYNISKEYEMMSFLGVQYDNCCWAVRFMGGRSFQNLSPEARPQYNNNVYLQIQLKGLGSVGNSDPANTLMTYLPGYVDTFHR